MRAAMLRLSQAALPSHACDALQIPAKYTHYASVALFFWFGLVSLKDVLMPGKVLPSPALERHP